MCPGPAPGTGWSVSSPEQVAADPDAVVDADLLETVKKAAVELKRTEVPFALCGGWAVYARGGPRSEHDADFALLERDVPAALDALAAAGFSTDTDAPEDWLAKVWDRGNLVDLIFRLSGNRSPRRSSAARRRSRSGRCRCRCWPRPTWW